MTRRDAVTHVTHFPLQVQIAALLPFPYTSPLLLRGLWESASRASLRHGASWARRTGLAEEAAKMAP